MAYDKVKIKKVIIILLLVGITIVAVIYWRHSRYHFTPEKWAISFPNERHRLIGSLELQHNLVGMNKEQILSLLSSPDTDTGYGLFLYDLGEDSTLGYKFLRLFFRGRHYYFYYIRFDENYICTRAYISGPPGG